MDLTRRQTPNIAAGEEIGRRPMTSFSNVGTWPPADFRTVVRPKFGPLCSSPWLDLTAGPVVVPVPDSDGRFRLMPMLEMWTGIFAAPGWRTAAEIFACAADLMQVIPPHLTARRSRRGCSGSASGPARISTSPPPTRWGLGANLPEDAVYPASLHDLDGTPRDGAHAHTLHFAAGALPPVDLFWSITLHDAEGFQVANPLDRFARSA